MLRKVRNYPEYRNPNELREVEHTKTKIFPILITDIRGTLPNRSKWSQMESMFMGHFQIALNPYEFCLRKNEAKILYTHTLSYSVPNFE